MTRVPRDATAFAHRDAEAMVVAATFLAPDASDADVDTALQPWRPIAELGSGAYANFLGTATDSDIADIYPPATYERLARVKRAYDPTNLFSRNHNISPAG
jgi:FAD/FMN-containing dehydrogenase